MKFMEFIVPGICALLVILGLVAIIMSRSNWRIPQMILVIFVLIGSLVFFFLAARALRTRDNWQAEIRDYQKKINATRNGDPSAGESAQKGITQLTADRDRLKQQLAEAMAERGRVWPGAIKDKVNSATGEIFASFDQQPPAGLEPKSVVFIFELDDNEKRGAYLGEFTVLDAKKDSKQVRLAPSSALVQRELNIIGNSKGPFILYEIMPVDTRSLFAERFEADPNAKTLLPQSSRDEYVRDQKPAKYDLEKEPKDQPEGNDPMERVRVLVRFVKAWPETAAAPAAPIGPATPAAPAGPAKAGGNVADAAKAPDDKSFKPGDIAYLDVATAKELAKTEVVKYEKSDPATFLIYSRPLRDYARLFREAYRERNELFAQKAEISTQAQQVESALAQVKDDITAAQTQKQGLSKDLAKFKAELASVVAFNQSLDAQLAKTRATLSELFKANLRLSAQLADIEKKLYDEIRSKSPPAEASASVGR
jgi:hypothetical protein